MDPVTFALLLQVGEAAIKGGGELASWWVKVHQISKQELPLDAQQAADLDNLIESRKVDQNWQPDES